MGGKDSGMGGRDSVRAEETVVGTFSGGCWGVCTTTGGVGGEAGLLCGGGEVGLGGVPVPNNRPSHSDNSVGVMNSMSTSALRVCTATG